MTGAGGGDDDDHDLGGDDESVRGMRSVWLSMRDEEPSGRGMAALMAAARAQVAATQPAPAWKRAWTAVTELLRRPPVLALATIVVVAGTAALVTSHGGLTTEEPRAAQTAPMVAPATGHDDGRAGGLLATDQVRATDKKEAVARDAPAAVAPGSAPVVAAPAPPPPPPPPPVNHAPMKKAPSRPSPPDESRVKSKSASGRFGANLDDESLEEQPTTLAGPSANAPMARPSADPTAPGDAAPVAPGAAQGRSETVLVQQLRECQAAAKRGDCAAVRTMVERLRARDAAFYRTAVAKDAAIAKCLASP